MFKNFSYGLSAALMGAAIVVVQPQIAVTQTLDEQAIASIAKEVTVVINGQNPGSGVIIGKKDRTYYVLTAKHVVATPDEYEILTSHGTKYTLKYGTVKKIPGLDLALVQFTSNENYRIAEIADSDKVTEGVTVYTSGWPHPGRAITERIYQITGGRISGRSLKPLEDGYGLIYTNITRSGMSGGPVLDDRGRVIGIHGRAEGVPIVDPENGQTVDIKSGFNLAIPIKSFFEISAINDIPPNSKLAPILLGWGIKLHKEKQIKAAADYYQKALAQDANVESASLLLGLIKYEQGDVEGAIRDWQNESANLSPNQSKNEYRPRLAQFAIAAATYAKGDRQACLEIMSKLERPHEFLIEFEDLKENLWGDRLLAEVKKMSPEFLPSKIIRNSTSSTSFTSVEAVAITPDGQTLATGENEKIKLWNVTTGELKSTFSAVSGTFSALAISPDGQTLAGGRRDLKLWDIRTGELKRTLTGNFFSIVFSPDSRTLATADDTSVKLWDVATGQLQTTLTGHAKEVGSIAFSPDGQMLASFSEDGNIKLWNVKTRQLQTTINNRSGDENNGSSSFFSVAISQDNQIIARTTPNNIELLDIPTQRVIDKLEGNRFYYLLINGNTLLSIQTDNTLNLWDVSTRKLQRILYGTSYSGTTFPKVGISSDGKILASASQGEIWIWNLSDRKVSYER